MTHLRIYDAAEPATPAFDSRDPAEIAKALAGLGVRFEQWPSRPLAADVDQAAVLTAFAPEIERLRSENGYQSVDVMRLLPDNPDKDAIRTKFLSEHRHSEDEVRFFVEGEGLFSLRSDDDRIYAVLCGEGDLISVPAGMRHWFDMGSNPRFTVVRLFTNPDGWIAKYTGDTIADRFPRHEPIAA